MIETISELEALCTQRAKSIWGDLDVVCEFSPLTDLTLGDLGSDYAQRIASALRLSLDEVVAKFLDGFDPAENATLRSIEGFINAKFDPNLSSLVNLRSEQRQSAPHSILVLGGCGKEGWSTARLLGSAVTQALLNGCKKISLGTFDIPLTNGPGSAFRQGVETILSRGADLTVGPEISGEMTVWATSELWSSVTRRRRGEREGLFTPYCSKEWLEMEEFPESLAELRDAPDLILKSLAVFLAGPLPGAELDLTVAEFDEEQNLCWFITAMKERISKWVYPRAAATPPADILVSEMERDLLIRLTFLEELRFRAAFRGELQTFIKGSSQTLKNLNRYLNSPQFRGRMERGELTDPEAAILTAASQGVDNLARTFSLLP